MSVSRRSILAAASAGSAGLTLSPTARSAKASAQAHEEAVVDQTVADLVRRSEEAHAALMRGDVKRYCEAITYTDDFTLMSPFGGKPTRGSELTVERIEAMGRFFKNGTFEQELIQAYGSADMVVLALIERQHVEVGELPAQDWPLRVTLVYRREGAEWRLAHRHADPLVKGVSLQQAAALASGEVARDVKSDAGVALPPDPTPGTKHRS
ncbi:ketosteroid isomerase-like protein [Rhizobium sp. BK313]|uniref:YybH family protein n=1 Tax=Rhizobium sp. BK313 TaxID=2587081 RepID=UPI00105BAFCE|nr:nuclear transport factor 2 family protein [Rhizobium sp. BK313]MBB3453725.1 ketosteroid isomerase-like protein [Rhizobium sp. BK313]